MELNSTAALFSINLGLILYKIIKLLVKNHLGMILEGLGENVAFYVFFGHPKIEIPRYRTKIEIKGFLAENMCRIV